MTMASIPPKKLIYTPSKSVTTDMSGQGGKVGLIFGTHLLNGIIIQESDQIPQHIALARLNQDCSLAYSKLLL